MCREVVWALELVDVSGGIFGRSCAVQKDTVLYLGSMGDCDEFKKDSTGVGGRAVEDGVIRNDESKDMYGRRRHLIDCVEAFAAAISGAPSAGWLSGLVFAVVGGGAGSCLQRAYRRG